MTGAETLALESIRSVLFEIMVYGTNYEDVPYKELDRPRYQHLKERVDATLKRVVKAVDGAGWAIVPVDPSEQMMLEASRVVSKRLSQRTPLEPMALIRHAHAVMTEAGRLKP